MSTRARMVRKGLFAKFTPFENVFFGKIRRRNYHRLRLRKNNRNIRKTKWTKSFAKFGDI